MKFLCLDVPQPDATMDQYAPHMLDEVRHAWQLYKGGIIRDIYFRQDRPGVAIFAEAETIEDAKAALDEFPLAKANLIGWEIIPIGPFTGWEALFAASND
ncbi:superoxide dismutase [Pseudomonas gingeri]|uniref:superoxide dismutase n=1 Tax=Pseudomonas gingeri TaxID=117681 RepID=UPI0015A06DF2|nr:superoxide dismutase [Pseudomonas gingeri]NWD68908.1 superoxide dismutase [Pseudomonas gingeri]